MTVESWQVLHREREAFERFMVASFPARRENVEAGAKRTCFGPMPVGGHRGHRQAG